jgi:opacity protein-like surface antigen
MKKVISLTACLLLSCPTLCVPTTANQPKSPLPNQTRIGFGFAGEYLSMEAQLRLEPSLGLTRNNMVGLNDISTKQSQTGKRLQIAPFVEFGKAFKNTYYLGLFVSWHYSGLKSSEKSTIEGIQYFQHEFTLKYSTDIFFKAGYQLPSQTMIYGVIGPSLTTWAHTSAQFENNQDPVPVNKFQTRKTALGLGLGIGIEYFIRQNYALSLDYIHHFHKSASKNQSMSYQVALPYPMLPANYSGDLNRKIDLSYATIALRFTAFF